MLPPIFSNQTNEVNLYIVVKLKVNQSSGSKDDFRSKVL